ncbi:AAA family ATPase [Actinoplanes sp. CA-030573]|uniref:AAA family ATPase n=1 Tax=Actinoplanes sp. CA-030573 TaxID=3239898 RepID=UPI003D91705E
MFTALVPLRDAETSDLCRLVDPPPAESHVHVLAGEPGMGKTILLGQVIARAREQRLTVLSSTGRESEKDLAFAGLHQLLRPVLDRLDDLPARQAHALRGAFGLTDDPVPPDALLTGLALLTVLSQISEEHRLLVVLDDCQWLDQASLNTVIFAAHRLLDEPVTLILAGRTKLPTDFATTVLQPLTSEDSTRLLDQQPHPPRGQARAQILAQAAGNPLALTELSKVVRHGHHLASEPLPLTDRLTAIMAATFQDLPSVVREDLLLAAVADGARVPGVTAATLAPAEKAGLVRIDGAGPQFTHPLVRAAVYHAVPFAERAAVHLRVAEALHDQPDRRAWHRAAAALEPDEGVAALLERTAAQA